MSAAVKTFNAGTNEHSLNPEDSKYFCEVIKELSGITLKSSKNDLIRTRTRSRLVALGLESYSDYRAYLAGLPKDHEEWQIFINLLTTNKTDFFREPKHFEFLVQKILPSWLKTNEKTLKVWCAASSTGEEAYTLAMILDRHLPKDRDFKILATDIDTSVLESAQNGVYSNMKRDEVPGDYQGSYLEFGKNSADGWFRMKKHLKSKITFKRHNLIEATSPGNEVFDIVFCRNVFIYFSPSSIEFVVKKLYASTKTGGYFFIGHSESLQSIKHDWQMTAPSTFQKGRSK